MLSERAKCRDCSSHTVYCFMAHHAAMTMYQGWQTLKQTGATCETVLPQLLVGEGMDPPRAAMERCSWPSRWAAVGMLGIPPGPTTCPLPGDGPCPAEGNACSSAGLISGPCATARGHEVAADREAEAARWATASACLTGSFSLEVGGSAVDACEGKLSEPKPLA